MRFILRGVVSIPCQILAFLAARSIVNKVAIEIDFVFKQRVWYAGLLRMPGNFFLRMRKAPVKVLSVAQWHQRERELAGATIVDGMLKLKRLSGVSLSEYLDSDRGDAQKSQAVSAAIVALMDFHKRFEQTHGDAWTGNVMIRELPNDEMDATWFDFDVAHVGPFSNVNRADDLRALLTTTGLDFESFLPGINNLEIECEFRNIVKSLSTDIFHIAQRIRAGASSRRKVPAWHAEYED